MHPDYAGSLDHRLDELRDKRSSIRLFLYGTGAQSRIALRLLGEKDLTPDAYIVDDKYYSAETVNGIPVLKYSDYCGQQESRDNIWICIDNRDLALAVKERLKTDNVIIASFPIEAYRKDHYLDIRYYLENKGLFDQTRAMLDDEESAVTFDEYVNACVTGDTSGLAEHNREKQYFNDITRGIDPSVFVDCGAFIGDSVVDFLEFYGQDRVRRIYSFEPDGANIAEINRKVADKIIPPDKFVLFDKGVSDGHHVFRFNSAGDGSVISEDGDIEIEVDSIDNRIPDGDRVTFIKMDVEGSELDALKGVSRIISGDVPALAVCVYHKREDLITIPQYIASLDTGSRYTYYIRHHNDNLMELVLYAIPH